MSEFIEEIKMEIPNIDKTKEEMFNVWKCIFNRIDKKYYSIKIISSEDVEIIEELVKQMQFSRGKEKLCRDLGYDPKGNLDENIIKERIYKLIINLKTRQQQNPKISIGNFIGEELHYIAKKEAEESSKVKEYKKY